MKDFNSYIFVLKKLCGTCFELFGHRKIRLASNDKGFIKCSLLVGEFAFLNVP